jgi:hypothetical protein
MLHQPHHGNRASAAGASAACRQRWQLASSTTGSAAAQRIKRSYVIAGRWRDRRYWVLASVAESGTSLAGRECRSGRAAARPRAGNCRSRPRQPAVDKLFVRGLRLFQRFINEVLEVPNRTVRALPVQNHRLIIHTEDLVNGTNHIAQGLARSICGFVLFGRLNGQLAGPGSFRRRRVCFFRHSTTIHYYLRSLVNNDLSCFRPVRFHLRSETPAAEPRPLSQSRYRRGFRQRVVIFSRARIEALVAAARETLAATRRMRRLDRISSISRSWQRRFEAPRPLEFIFAAGRPTQTMPLDATANALGNAASQVP